MNIVTAKMKINDKLITAKKYKINGTYTEERENKHRIIISNKIRNKIPSEQPEAILLGGGSGAGKSTIVRHYFLSDIEDLDSITEYTYIDADQIKLMLDEYKEYIKSEENVYFAAFYVHAESGDIVNLLLQECINNNLSFIYDGTMSWMPLYTELLPKLKAKSYLTFGVYVDVDLKVALQRAIERGKEEKRYVAPEVVEKANRNSAIVFKRLKPEFDEVMMFNNTKEREKGSDLPLQAFYKREQHFTELFLNGDILNNEELEIFLEKSDLEYIE